MESAYLQLLLADAPVDDFDRPLREAAVAGADADELRRLEHAHRLALAVRERLEGYRRRERELEALYETAGDLTSLRDLGKVLQAIVRRARQLLGTDVAYLTLIDEDEGDTYMRVTEGIVTSEFPRLRLPLGTGLGGLVAATASPYYTANYAADARFDHTREIDRAVTDEGLVAILGVPMLVGDRVIGVLFAANRRERPFAAEEVALLSSLAAHAAIAIENARLFQETRQALADLDRATADLQAHTDAVERAAAAHERLTRVALHGGGVADVAEAVVGLLGGRLDVVATDGRRIASAGAATRPVGEAEETGVGRHAAVEEPVRAALTAALGEGATRALPAGRDRSTGLWIVPIVAGAERLGALVLDGLPRIDDADLRTLERAALVCSLVLLHERSLADAEQRVRGELLGDMLDGRLQDARRLHRRAQLAGLDLERDHAVVVALAGDRERRTAALAAAELARVHGGLAGEHRRDVVLLLGDLDPATAARQTWERLREVCHDPVTVAAAGPAAGPAAFASAAVEARHCLHALLALDRRGQWATAAELGAYALVLGHTSSAAVRAFLEHSIGPLLAYDARKGTDLCRTLEAYFDVGGNVAAAARHQHVHVNTLYQRLERITDLIGDGWRTGDGALQVQLALRLHRIAAGSPGEPEDPHM